MTTHSGTSGKLALSDYANNQNILWKVESNCNKTHIFSTVFDTRANVEFVTIKGAMYSGFLSLDLTVSNSFFVAYSAGVLHHLFSKPGVVLFWECHHGIADSTCCSDIKASGFSNNEINGVYTFTGNFINGRHLYVENNNLLGIWFNGLSGNEANWVLGWMSSLSEGKVTIGWAKNAKDTSCPTMIKAWNEWWSGQWQYQKMGVVRCLSGYKR